MLIWEEEKRVNAIGSVGTFSLGSFTVLTSSAMLDIKKKRLEGYLYLNVTLEELVVSYVLLYISFGNDHSAGSPTETLLRLLLHLNDEV